MAVTAAISEYGGCAPAAAGTLLCANLLSFNPPLCLKSSILACPRAVMTQHKICYHSCCADVVKTPLSPAPPKFCRHRGLRVPTRMTHVFCGPAGAELPEGIQASVHVRKNSSSPGAIDIYYFDQHHTRYRSKLQVGAQLPCTLVGEFLCELKECYEMNVSCSSHDSAGCNTHISPLLWFQYSLQ